MASRSKASKWGTLVLAASLIGVIALISGVTYEQVQRAHDRERLPQVGRSVDIGGRTLNIDCSGAGQPAIILQRGSPWPFLKDPKEIFQNGSPRPGYSWVAIQRELAKLTTTCWYDRAGSGWSDPGPYPRDTASQARDLHALLEGAHVPPPYVLVAEATAALDAHVYAGFYPGDVAGMVLVNGVHPDLLTSIRPGTARMARFPRFVGQSQDAVAQASNQLGLYRLGAKNRPAPATPQGIADLEWNTIWRLTEAAKARTALVQDIASWPQSTAEARAAGTLGDRPLIVIDDDQVVAPEFAGVWAELQGDLARLSSRGRHVALDAHGGDPVYEAPGSIADAVRQVLGEVRGQP